ncbi:SH3 domain-containing protein [Pikeienuella piscinae]|uniref:SH3 domain-containing protein n=1 Tax=Pikeienuella piscinae TaxID=2748098 RepID=A0A7L5C0X3_9RHOB|nr:caspase family protein [Pikeienuella piscinae]QIE56427.1 SH3 domain-containing protein [Pikeienuella piscinae]
MLRILVLILVLFAPAAMAKNVALVIGNGAYAESGSLRNAAKDARDMADRLRGLAYDVIDGYDLTRIEMLEQVETFARRVARDDVALFYYSGHGAQLGGENYLIPVDARFAGADALQSSSVKLKAVLRTMELRARTRVVILDACRNNPFVDTTASRSAGAASRGLARLEAGVGSFIAFSTAPNDVATDGAGGNSPFTAALIRHIGTRDDDIHEVMRHVRADVVRETSGRQTPWENSSLLREVYLAAPPDQSATGDTPQAPAPASLHYVDGLDPQGDNFLALRSAPAGRGGRIDKMAPGTELEVLDRDGAWARVRLRDGREGWAHSNWIRCCRAAGAKAETPRAASADAAPQGCDALWHARNAIWDSYGYCFTSARGRAAFGANGCSRDMEGARAAMTPADIGEIERIAAAERAAGCR